MSGEVLCVHPDYGALPETSANWTLMYPYDEDPQRHASLFYNVLESAFDVIRSKDEPSRIKLKGAKSYCDLYYNWEVKQAQWTAFLSSIKDLPTKIEKAEQMFVYRAG
jgi:hypothetical protein